MLRRNFLAALAATPLARAKQRFPMSRISFITDEAAATPADAIAFCKQYGLNKVELRGVPGGKGHYGLIPDAEIKQAAKELSDNGIKVSFLNTPFFKITLPGSEPVFRRPETPENRDKRVARHQAEFDRRKESFQRAFQNCHVLGVNKMRVFSFLRVAEPRTVFQQTADVVGEMANLAGQEGIDLLVENETSCNVVTGSEVADFLKLMPQKNVGFNWDPLNETGLKEVPYPDGYAKLPKKRIWNVQVKGKSLLEPDEKLDWAGIFDALARDGYKGCVGLETHYFDGTKIEKSHLCMKEIRRILES
ncbi:MAG: sugar phosphate isomerase/epimerase [Bryobacteraceae bacterium]|nr:sugar phosphate isomerase/epimerase [Bryobacteraceae bacterium]